MALDLSQLTSQQQMAAVYIGYYDRAADPFGQDFWLNALQNPNLSLELVADDFSTQPETLANYPFFSDPTEANAAAFITEVFLNLFNRPPEGPDDVAEGEVDGLTFWSDALLAAINGDEGALSVGEIILAIIGGAQDGPQGNDRATILNKIEVATSWTDAADAAGFNQESSYEDNPSLQNSAKSIIEPVTDEASSVVSAKDTIDDFFDPIGVPGEEFFLTSSTDVIDGTADDDEFLAYIQQNPFAGGVSNSLSSADRLDGDAGRDRLYAELTAEFVGSDADDSIDVQPRLKNIEEIDIEARENEPDEDFFNGDPGFDLGPIPRIGIPVDTGGDSPIFFLDEGFLGEESIALGGFGIESFGGLGRSYYQDSYDVIVDGKNITDHEEIGSYFSDGDLLIENLTTLTHAGTARNTEAITVTMDHTDNFDSDGDASDLIVLFDNDYLLSGQEAEGKVFYFLLDEDAELAGLDQRLFNIDVDGIRFNITNADGTVTDVTIESPAANVAGTHQGFVNALQDPLQALIADGTLPAGTTLTLDPTITDFTFLDDGSRSDDIPAIVLTSGDGSVVEATGFTRISEPIGEYDVYGRFRSENEVEDQPITVNIDLHKVGRGGEGGNLVIGGKSESTPDGIADGIEVFRINVLGAGNDDPNGGMTKPSDLGTVTSTGDELREIYIATDPVFAAGDTYASLRIRDGFNEIGDFDESGDLQLVNADAFLGDLTLGTTLDEVLTSLLADFPNDSGPDGFDDLIGAVATSRITNLDTLTAQGGGNVTFSGILNGTEEAQAYSYTTGSGDDYIEMVVLGDALDYAGSSLNISTNGGNDEVVITSPFVDLESAFSGDDFSLGNQELNQVILDNVTIETGAGDDVIRTEILSRASTNIDAGAGEDFIDTSGGATFVGGLPTPLGGSWAFNFDDARGEASDFTDFILNPDDLPGVPTSLAYIGGATVTVTLSGAGAGADGLLAGGGVMAFDGADPFVNGYEAQATVVVDGPNEFYGTQVDINNAVIEAITSDPVLSKLITLELTENNTWVMQMNTRGFFEASGETGDVLPDIRIDIEQADFGDDPADWNAVEAEARQIFQDSSIEIGSLAGANEPVGGANSDDPNGSYDAANLSNSIQTDEWYTGLSSFGDDTSNAPPLPGVLDGSAAGPENQIFSGLPAILEQDNVINAGSNDAADDLIVLNTDNFPLPPEDPFTPIPGNTLLNNASNETIVFEGNFGNDTIMNFGTSSFFDIVSLDRGTFVSVENYGLDFLDYSDYLTSVFDSSDGPGPDGPESEILIPVTLDYNEDDDLAGGDIDANEVGVVRMTDGTGDDSDETWEALAASDVEALFNNSTDDGDYGDLLEGNFAANASYDKDGEPEDLIGDAKAIFKVENGANLGEYKVFELTWSGDTDDEDGDVVSAVLLGTQDYGTSLTELTEINLVGSELYDTLIENGFAPVIG